MIHLIAALATYGLLAAHKSVVCFGDSVTLKYGAALKHELAGTETSVTVIAAKDQPVSVDAMRKALESRPDYVAISLGTDLSGRKDWPIGRDSFVPSVEALIGVVRAAPSHPKVFLCVPPPTTLPETDPRSRRLATEIVPLLKQAARETNCPLIDFEGALRDRSDLINGLELDEEGAEILADTVAESISNGLKADWRIVHADSEESDEGPAKNAIDGDPDSYWHTNYSTSQERYPHELDVDTGSIRVIGGFSYLPRQDGVNGRVAKYEFYVSVDGKDWGKPVASGIFPRSSDATKIHLEKPVTGRYFRFRALSEQQGQIWASAAELDILKFYPKRH